MADTPESGTPKPGTPKRARAKPTPSKAAAAKPSSAKPKASTSTASAPRNRSTNASSGGTAAAKDKFSRALEDAKAGAMALKAEAEKRSSEVKQRLTDSSTDWKAEAKTAATDAKKK